ncbi:MAG: ABC transporter ATP-binding protein [Firmicutes bacterium]|nr:ABC transporter ATP-binding protein [Bacillota bacterium]
MANEAPAVEAGGGPESGLASAVIETTGLCKRYGEHWAVRDLNLTIREGEVFGLLGPNGAGKTTTILMLLGLTEPTSGSARVLGHNPFREPLPVKAAVGYLPENVGFYDDMTGRDNLLYTARLNGLTETDARARIDALLEAVGLAGAADRPVRVYSRGMRQRLGLADVLVKSPRVVILDEPTLGIDPAGTREILSLISRLAREERVTILISSHLLHQVQQICHRVGIFVRGKLIAHGSVDELSQQLAGGAPLVVDVEVGEAGSRARELLERLDGVTAVDGDPQAGRLSVRCARDVRADIARTLVGHGLPLLGLHVHTYGLDDIYHTYFEGGSADGEHVRDAARRLPA